MKRLRSLPQLDLKLHEYPLRMPDGSIEQKKAPLSVALNFLRDCNAIEDGEHGTKGKTARLRRLLFQKYQECFGVIPSTDLPLRVLRCRIAHRLQWEGFRIAGETPPEKFTQNYNAVMKFNDNAPYDGMADQDAWVAKRLTLTEGMASMKKLKRRAEKPEKLKKVGTKPGPRKERELLFGEFTPTAMIRYLAKEFDSAADEIDAVMIKLGQTVKKSTIMANRSCARTGTRYVPSVTRELREKLKNMLPKSAEPHRMILADEKKPVKLAKKLKK